ncbi:MAG: class I SAM-dependent methyltransferase [Gammaproteobacteria bacterium]
MDKQELVKSISSRSSIKNTTTDAFRKTGRQAAEIVKNKINKHFHDLGVLNVLDFGAGSGRVAIPLASLINLRRFCCVDVDREAIEYLAMELGESCEASVNGYVPPLCFKDNSFDFVYSISVWSHMPEDLSMTWLKETQRIVRPGGIVLITVAGEVVLDHWKKHYPAQWSNVEIDAFNKQKFIYKAYPHIDSNEKQYPGISGKGSWGNTLIHEDYVRAEWSALFDILEFEPSGMNGQQDIVVLRSRG